LREQLDSYGRIGVGALVGAAVAALLYGGLAYGDETPVDLARHPEVEPLQPGAPTHATTSLDAVSLTTAPKAPTSSSTTTTATSTTTTSKHSTTTTHHTTTTVAQPTTTTHQAPPPTTTTTKQPCGLLWC
jgi:cytoskeletal protein RodZ